MIKDRDIRQLTDVIRRLNKYEVAEKIPHSESGNLQSVYEALEDLRIKLLENNTYLSASDERTQRQISAVAHDLKMYIALISGYAECLQDGMNDRDYLALIREKCVEMNENVLKVIDDSKTSAEQLKKRIRLVKLRDFLPQVLKKIADAAIEKNITVSVSRIPNVRIAVYESDFESVLMNVASNAVRYTPENGKIRISVHTSLRNLIIYVTDSGPGVAHEDVPLIFERYYTGDKARTTGNGTGVGLADAKEIMLRHSGGIEYVERKKPGAKFLIYLPRYMKIRELLTPTEMKLVLSVLFLVFFPFFVVFAFFNVFITAAFAIRENKALKRRSTPCIPEKTVKDKDGSAKQD